MKNMEKIEDFEDCEVKFWNSTPWVIVQTA